MAAPSPAADLAQHIAFDRAAGVPWKVMERSFGLSRSRLFRIKQEYFAKRNILALSAASSLGDHAVMTEAASCQTCDHWKRRPEKDRQSQGRCLLATVARITEEWEYCSNHPVLQEAANLRQAKILGTAIADALAIALKPPEKG